MPRFSEALRNTLPPFLPLVPCSGIESYKCGGTQLKNCQTESVQLRFSGVVSDVPLIGAPTSFVSERGEEKRRQAQRAERVLCCKPVSTKERGYLIAESLVMGGSLRNKDLFRFLPVGLGAFFAASRSYSLSSLLIFSSRR